MPAGPLTPQELATRWARWHVDPEHDINVLPGPDGELDPIAYQRLKEIGAWMKINGEAIYGSRMCHVFGENDSIHFTRSKDKKTQFIFLSSFPNDKVLLTKMDIDKHAGIQMMGSNKKIAWKKTEQGIEITVPQNMKQLGEYVWVLKVQQ